MKKIIYTIIIVLIPFIVETSCTDYLDVVPDNIPTIDHAFNKRYQAESFLYGLYGFLPYHASVASNPAFYAGEETWLFKNFDKDRYFNSRMWEIAIGEQGTESPIGNYWASSSDNFDLKGGRPLFTAIRDCNVFLENIHKPVDLEDWERKEWIAEVKFLKAYFHFWLLRMYGPIPILKENVPIYEDTETVSIFREPVDEAFSYIVELLDEAIPDLPLIVMNLTENLGRISKPTALAFKAKVLLYEASPFYNGNSAYTNMMIDKRGIDLFPSDYDHEKWKKAIDAAKEAIEVSHEAGHKLFDFESTGLTRSLSEETSLAMQVRGAVTELWNDEIIWANPNSTTVGKGSIQFASMPAFAAINTVYGDFAKTYGPTLNVVEQFYTENGVPIEEDKDWVGIDIYELQKGDEKHKYYISQNWETIKLHFNREARFYGSVIFDGSLYFGNGAMTDKDMWVTELKEGSPNTISLTYGPITGYLAKKVLNRYTSTTKQTSTINYYRYAFPVIRLADLYLMYAEALNEYKETPDDEVYEYIDLVRKRTGLNGVVESWANHSLEPDKPLSREGMREIIRRERLIELAFEGHRYWDLRRWNLLEEYMNKPIRALNVWAKTTEEFNQPIVLDYPVFEKKDYLWPIRQGNLTLNSNLMQNPGW
jgi:hypothetical protein